jgi:hypothetical protein
MQFMILFARTPENIGVPIPEALRDSEFHAIRRLYGEAVLRQVWLRSDVSGACALIEAESTEHATSKINQLPLVEAGILERPLVIPLKPYAGFTVP